MSEHYTILFVCIVWMWRSKHVLLCMAGNGVMSEGLGVGVWRNDWLVLCSVEASQWSVMITSGGIVKLVTPDPLGFCASRFTRSPHAPLAYSCPVQWPAAVWQPAWHASTRCENTFWHILTHIIERTYIKRPPWNKRLIDLSSGHCNRAISMV